MAGLFNLINQINFTATAVYSDHLPQSQSGLYLILLNNGAYNVFLLIAFNIFISQVLFAGFSKVFKRKGPA